MDGWKISFLLGWRNWQVQTVSFRECIRLLIDEEKYPKAEASEVRILPKGFMCTSPLKDTLETLGGEVGF